MKMIRVLGLLSLAIVVVRCDIGRGVLQEVQLAQRIDHHCVQRALDRIQEIDSYKLVVVEPYKVFSLTKGIHKTPIRYDYLLYGEQKGGVISVYEPEQGRVSIGFSFSRIGEPPPQELVDKARIIFDKVRIELKAVCPEYEVYGEIKEDCYGGVQCPANN